MAAEMRVVVARCPYFGRLQPSNMRSYNRHPLCLGCAERLAYIGGNDWRHESDPKLAHSRENRGATPPSDS